jgi:hypothetical protein
VALEHVSPRAGEVVVCRIATSLVTEDPDFEIVRYRYTWRSGARLVRRVTSAALSDALRNNAARPEETLTCGDAVGREAPRPDRDGQRDAAGLENGARPRPGSACQRSLDDVPRSLFGQSWSPENPAYPCCAFADWALAAGAFAAGFAAGEEPPASAIVAQIAASRITPASTTSRG